jgi:uncharacterized Zn finger protein
MYEPDPLNPGDLQCPQCYTASLVTTEPVQLHNYVKAQDILVVCTTCGHVYTLQIIPTGGTEA